jgi:hypothetical protein
MTAYNDPSCSCLCTTLGSGTSVFSKKVRNTFQFKSLKAGKGIELCDGESISISSVPVIQPKLSINEQLEGKTGTVFIRPGTYHETIKLKNNVNLFFESGTVVTSDDFIFLAENISCSILGYGTFLGKILDSRNSEISFTAHKAVIDSIGFTNTTSLCNTLHLDIVRIGNGSICSGENYVFNVTNVVSTSNSCLFCVSNSTINATQITHSGRSDVFCGDLVAKVVNMRIVHGGLGSGTLDIDNIHIQESTRVPTADIKCIIFASDGIVSGNISCQKMIIGEIRSPCNIRANHIIVKNIVSTTGKMSINSGKVKLKSMIVNGVVSFHTNRLLLTLPIICNSGYLHFDVKKINSDSTILNITGNATIEFGGIWTTSAANLITNTGSPTLTLLPSKLHCATNFITTTSPINLVAMPSISNTFPGSGVSVIPSIAVFVNSLI